MKTFITHLLAALIVYILVILFAVILIEKLDHCERVNDNNNDRNFCMNANFF